MNYEITINPCNACTKKYERECCGINAMNSCVSETAAAFAGFPSINAIPSAGNCSADQCIANIRNKMGPFPGWYKNRKLARAPVFIQEPHYLPGLLSKGHGLEEAKNMCLMMCNSEECRQNCITDSDAVVSIRPSSNTCNLAKNSDYVNYVNIENTPVITTTPIITQPAAPIVQDKIPDKVDIVEYKERMTPSGQSCNSNNSILMYIGLLFFLFLIIFLLQRK